ncbi:tetratricopeptide repeat protein [Pseudomonadota bacterium]
MKQLIVLTALLMLVACGSSGQKNSVENPYAERMKDLSSNGVAAMQRERWSVAEKLFERALQAAQLANDPDLIASAWYNLGMLHVSAGNDKKGEAALERASSVSEQHQLEVTNMRARVALALLFQRQGREAWQPGVLDAAYPVDIHLIAARLSQLQQRGDIARREYEFVLRKREVNRTVMLYKMEAHMGLALLAEQQQDHEVAKNEIAQVLKMSREIGAPRLAAHALLLKATLTQDGAVKRDDLLDALAIYRALKDLHGQSDTLHQLMHLADHEGSLAELERLQGELDRVGERMVVTQRLD